MPGRRHIIRILYGKEVNEPMLRRMQTDLGELEAMEIGIEEPFSFHCTGCGKCCRNLGNILLTPKDMYHMSKELGLNMADFYEGYCETFLRDEIPVVKLKCCGPERRCIFLKEGKCAVYEAKPVICTLYPLGRYIQPETAKNFGGSAQTGQIRFFLNDAVCGDGKERHTVQGWLESAGIGLEDDFYIEWHGLIQRLYQFFCGLEGNIRNDWVTLAQIFAFVGIYLCYDTGKEFMPQFQKNAGEIMETLQKGGYGNYRREDRMLHEIRNRFRHIPAVLPYG